jgi:hypothetical protein
VSRLPVEIAILIFQNLDMEDVLILQSVSKTWKLLLSSRTLQFAVVQTLVLGLGVYKEDIQDTFVKKWKRLEEDYPVSEITFCSFLGSLSLEQSRPWYKATDYLQGYFAWADPM